MYHCHLDVHRPAAATRTASWRWHQDGGRQNLEVETDHPRPRLSVKVGWFLTDVARPGHGNLRVIPGSHLQNRLARPERPDLPAPPPPAPSTCLRAPVRRGFDRRPGMPEATTRRASPAGHCSRHTFRWIRARDTYPVSAPWFEDVSPVRRQLLGASTTAEGHWLPADEDVPLRAWMSERGLSPRRAKHVVRRQVGVLGERRHRLADAILRPDRIVREPRGDGLADAQVARRDDVGPAQAAGEEPLRRPPADPGELGSAGAITASFASRSRAAPGRRRPARRIERIFDRRQLQPLQIAAAGCRPAGGTPTTREPSWAIRRPERCRISPRASRTRPEVKSAGR